MATRMKHKPGAALRALADRVGIISEYRDMTGKETRATSDETRVAILAALGIDASTDEKAEDALAALDEEERAQLGDRVRVLPRSAPFGAIDVDIRTHGGGGTVEWTAELEEEEGEIRNAEGRGTPDADGRLRVRVPFDPPIGYHTLTLAMRDKHGEAAFEQSLIVVPPSCPSPEELLRGKVFGITANLYTVRSARNWGAGDFGDLATLLRWAGGVGAQFVGVNPLHALRNCGGDVSPYSPVSRLFRNPLYIDVEAVPGYAQSSAVREIVASPQFREELTRVRSADRVDYARVMSLKDPVLRALHAAHLRGPRDRNPEWRAWLDSQGESLEHFATFQALAEHLGHDGDQSGSWREWPEEYRDPRSAAVRRFRETHREEIDYHRWLQFVLDRQLADAARAAREAKMSIGLYQDLAIGTSPNGSDVWANPGLFVTGASVGAPPDPYSDTGQNWGLPPLDPRALKQRRYDYWIQLVRSSLRHGGALRIDHVMGLFRQFWIPEGKSGKEGAYVRFPSEDLIGILALESTRAKALVVGEDLGTVPEDVPPAMRRWGLLSSKVLYFERDDAKGFHPAESFAAASLATANTHDMPTLAGFWSGRDIEVRKQVGLLQGDDAEREARETRDRERRQLLERLRGDGLLAAEGEPRPAVLRGAVHEFLCRTPAALVGLSLDDVVGEAEPVNVPGVGADKFPSWTRRLSMPLEQLPTDPDVAAALRCGRAPSRETR
ncbi:MAG TPA: 4-alpha-glucanotransferase [Gemmatimonadaceae bacterium]